MALAPGYIRRPTNNNLNFASPSTKDHNHLNPSSPVQGSPSFILLGGLLGISHLIIRSCGYSSLLQCYTDLGNSSATVIMVFKKVKTCPFFLKEVRSSKLENNDEDLTLVSIHLWEKFHSFIYLFIVCSEDLYCTCYFVLQGNTGHHTLKKSPNMSSGDEEDLPIQRKVMRNRNCVTDRVLL